ncbi:hypothetical protein ACFLZM_04745 [Thermodesulfobacteriota bacterium]
MNRKKISFVLIVAALYGFVAAAPSSAGNVQRNRWEGVAIGIGAALLGSAIINHHHAPPPHRATVYKHRPYSNYNHRPDSRHGGWEVRKTWVPPIHKRVWNPGHYNRRGRWVRGGWIKITDRRGYWKKQREWVSHR